MFNISKSLLGVFIVGGCILGFIFNPYIGLIQLPVNIMTNISWTLRIVFQFIISIYILLQYVLPYLSEGLKKLFK